MPALTKTTAVPRLLPQGSKEAEAGAGAFLRFKSRTELHIETNNLDRLAHDARNILSGFTLFCELLAAPGVLTKPHAHYAQDLESIAKSASQILEKIVECVAFAHSAPLANPVGRPVFASAAVTDTVAELRHLQPLLAAIAGPAIRLSVATIPCCGRTALTVEDLTRILVNLVRNAADALPAGGNISITARYADGPSLHDSGYPIAPRSLLLAVADDGPGIPEALREQVFDTGFTTRSSPERMVGKITDDWPAPRHRGLGLSIVRNLVEAAGGTVRATVNEPHGARFEIILPLCGSITSGTYVMPTSTAFPADSGAEGCIECQ